MYSYLFALIGRIVMRLMRPGVVLSVLSLGAWNWYLWHCPNVPARSVIQFLSVVIVLLIVGDAVLVEWESENNQHP